MKPVEFVGQTAILSPPPGTPRGACGGLPVMRFDQPPSMSSFWKPDAEDLKRLNEGGYVRLDVMGSPGEYTRHPPVWISTDQCSELP